MANIVHESTGADSRNVVVSGTVLALPHSDAIRFDMQIDSGIVASGTDLTTWTSSVGAKVFTPYNSIATNKVQVDAANTLAGLSTIKIGRLSAASPYYYNMLYGDGTSYYNTVGNRIVPVVIIAKISDNANYNHILSCISSDLGGANVHQATFYVNPSTKVATFYFCDAVHPDYQETLAINLPAELDLTAWHVYHYVVDYVNKKIMLYIDGVEIYDETVAALAWKFTSPRDGFGGGGQGLFLAGARCNLAAFITWQAETFAEADFLATYLFLKYKYGL